MSTCRNCHESLSKGIFSSNRLLTSRELILIRDVLPEEAKPEHCLKCGGELLRVARMSVVEEISRINAEIDRLCNDLLVIHGPPPSSWDYFVISTLSEYKDLSAEINRRPKNLKKYEKRALLNMKKKAIANGGTVLSHFTIASSSNYLTYQANVIALKNLDVLLPSQKETVEHLQKAWKELHQCQELLIEQD